MLVEQTWACSWKGNMGSPCTRPEQCRYSVHNPKLDTGALQNFATISSVMLPQVVDDGTYNPIQTCKHRFVCSMHRPFHPVGSDDVNLNQISFHNLQCH
jgi:hypothetical protein